MGMSVLGGKVQAQPWHTLPGEVSPSFSDPLNETGLTSGAARPLSLRGVEAGHVLKVSLRGGTGIQGSRGHP